MVFQLVTIFLLAVKGGDGQVSEHVSLWVRVCVCVCVCVMYVCVRGRGLNWLLRCSQVSYNFGGLMDE